MTRGGFDRENTNEGDNAAAAGKEDGGPPRPRAQGGRGYRGDNRGGYQGENRGYQGGGGGYKGAGGQRK